MSSWIRFISKSSRIFAAEELLFAGTILLAATSAAAPSRAQPSGTQIRIDASQPYREPGPARYDEGSATTPSGVTLGVNSRYLTRNGKPWLPVMGEFHFSRYPRTQWEDEILKMKAAGVNIVATYVIWIHHEEVKDQFDWTGQRDLRVFAQLCAKHGLYMVARIGPWDHAEVRNGGLPDWVVQQGPTRVNDPVYLASVREWYGQVGAELKGLLWKDGGPVIGIQLENEYSQRGPGAGEAHILELKKIAIASGLGVPLYLITGWDNAVVPPRAVIPVYGGYSAAPWDSSIAKLPPPEVFAFRFQSRVAANVNTDSARGEPDATRSYSDNLPYLTAEIGGGIEDTYHRRPVITPDDIAAMVPVMLGSGVNLYGTYMFHGGENPDGARTTLEESQATGYPNDLPIKSYDFQAPLGEFGEERTSLRRLKVFQYFLNDFGADLAPMTVHAPETLPRSSTDLSVPRASVRSNGDAGFIFFNNYVRNYAMPARKAAQFLIRLPHGTLAVPRHPVDLPSGAYFIWPFNLRMGGITLRYSTAQLFTRIEKPGVLTIYFEALPGIPVELAFDAATVRTVKISSGETTRDSGTIYANGIQPGSESSIDLVSSQGNPVRLVVLTSREAEDAWKVHISGSDHLLITEQDFLADPDAQPAHIWLRSRATRQFAFTITPPSAAPLETTAPLTSTPAPGQAEAFTAEAPAWSAALECRQIRATGLAPPVKLGPSLPWRPHGVAQAPAAGELPLAAEWEITVPAGALNGLSELFLEVNYQGDVARLSTEHQLLDDNFYNGKPWMIGLKRFLAPDRPSTFDLSILPLRKDAPVYFELSQPPQFNSDGQIGKLDDILLVPEYQLVIDAGGK
ncbi:MAG: beta-galactosidase [Terracidiphilus sp.]